MSLTDKKVTKSDVAVYLVIISMMIFNGLIIYIFIYADLDIKVTGTIDPNTLMVVFLAVINSAMVFLGIRRISNGT